MSRYYLGIDGGQSSTTALIADETGRVLGIGHSGPCNHVTGAEGREKFLRVVGDCIRQAAAAIGETEFAAACLGFSGGAEDKLAYSRELIRTSRLKVTNDAEIALTGALAGEPGIIVIAGTGSIAYGRNSQGRTARAGGWGYIYGDEGGAFDLVRRGLRAALQFEEGWGAQTSVHPKLLRAAGRKTANDLLHYFYTQPRHTIAKLAPIVTECAEEGDPVAQQLIAEAATMLAWYTEGVYRNLFTQHERVAIAFIGGVFRSALIRSQFAACVRLQTGCTTAVPKFSPAAGALIEALRLDGNCASLSAVPETKI